MIERATLTVIEDSAGVLRYPARWHPLELLPNERNIVGRGSEARVYLARARGSSSRRLDVHVKSDTWVVRTSGEGARIDGRDLAVGEDAALVDACVVGWPGLELRFDVVRERPRARAQRRRDLVLLDCAGAFAPGRWPCLTRTGARGLVVTGPDATSEDDDDADDRNEGFVGELDLANRGGLMPALHESFSMDGMFFRRFDAVDGVPLKLLCRRGGGLEPALAVRLAARVARWLVDTNAPLALGTDSFAITWDGELKVLPPLSPRLTETRGRGVVVELFVTLFPENGDWFREGDGASMGARAIWHRLVDPYLGAFGSRPAEPDDLVTAATAADALEAVARDLPAIANEDIAAIVRGMFPDEWRLEQELREELALGIDALFE